MKLRVVIFASVSSLLIGIAIGWAATNKAWIDDAEFHDVGRMVWYADKSGNAFKVFEWRK